MPDSNPYFYVPIEFAYNGNELFGPEPGGLADKIFLTNKYNSKRNSGSLMITLAPRTTYKSLYLIVQDNGDVFDQLAQMEDFAENGSDVPLVQLQIDVSIDAANSTVSGAMTFGGSMNPGSTEAFPISGTLNGPGNVTVYVTDTGYVPTTVGIQLVQ